MKTVKTSKGTALPLTNLKGKDYLMVAYRIQWMNEDVPNFDIDTNILKMEKDESVVKAVVLIKDANGQVIKKASATKREDSKGFPDHLEKAETGAVGRALAMLGYGTQFALADLDEGERLADSPLIDVKQENNTEKKTSTSTFRKPGTKSNGASSSSQASIEGWD